MDHFDFCHIHTTPEGRHFRHGDGVEVDGEGNPVRNGSREEVECPRCRAKHVVSTEANRHTCDKCGTLFYIGE